MTMLRPFLPADVLAVDLQPTQALDAGALDLAYGERAATGPAWTAFDERDGRILGCGGIVPVFATQGLAWALFAARVGHGMTIITRQARDAVRASRCRRIEAIVRADFAAGIRWAAAIGLERRVILRNWGPACSDHWLFEVTR